ncbi:hypothetical protein BTM_1578 [Burkholderia thailandensis 34]|uniref:hypothetical protein n=1 Tax=Burkholderia thailandensis TaxID=57975 RepID=UPI0005D87B97|nr:hypothetical protein [Burkholderia thailandensis]AJY27733.1 hypothetical protein BTM_1578 [Burkholderia thailandensis 34]AOJ55462.1 hypothetical protein AQ477_02320 [Burkholderia thailandensis]KXF60535.1 hypothetical protein AQ476_04005 [Burkholderia thailandensis]PNE75409.1 hypothetical protein A8H37_27650 [Burkholderia thailandensis]
MLSFYVYNLLIPGDPNIVSLTTPAGTWTLTKAPNYAAMKQLITTPAQRPQQLPVAETYFLENPVGMQDGSAAVDRALDEVTPILLAASYATGRSVTIERSTMGSSIQIVQPSDHWPRVRSMGHAGDVINSDAEFTRLVEAFVQAWPAAGQTEKGLVLIHHWIDAQSCWSMEDLYLSATTLLQVIVKTESARQNGKHLYFYNGVTDAAARMGITPLSTDFRDMRNDLVHEGTLSGTSFPGKQKADCAAVIAETLNWFDEYVHVALGLGQMAKVRFSAQPFLSLNAYSLS